MMQLIFIVGSPAIVLVMREKCGRLPSLGWRAGVEQGNGAFRRMAALTCRSLLASGWDEPAPPRGWGADKIGTALGFFVQPLD